MSAMRQSCHGFGRLIRQRSARSVPLRGRQAANHSNGRAMMRAGLRRRRGAQPIGMTDDLND